MGKLDIALNRGLVPLLRLPEHVARHVVGAPPTNDLGVQLDFQTHVLLRVAGIVRPQEVPDLGVTKGREMYRDAVIALSPPSVPLPMVEDHAVACRGGEVLARLYKPSHVSKLPVCMYMHGGGFCIGDVEGYDALCRYVADGAHCAVLSVDYRLAPEHKFPAALEDCVDTFNWLHAEADRLGLDPERIAVAGDSAGGKLALLVSQEQIEASGPRPNKIFSLYPATWQGHVTESREQFAEGFLLTGKTIDWFNDCYFGDHDEHSDPRVSPILYERLSEMPPTYLATAGFDPLRDEGDLYADKLEAAGVEVTKRRFDELPHGYVTLGGALDAARRATDDFISQLRAWGR